MEGGPFRNALALERPKKPSINRIKTHFPLKSLNFGFISFAHLVMYQITEYNDRSRNGSSPKGNVLRIFFISDHKINATMSASYTEYAKNTKYFREKKF